jgi:pimeloyl-ACP methyl ester carboxylesterase/ketosteroid isomerase-like protein
MCVATAAFAADPVQELRLAEIAFAKAFADHDAAKFQSFLLDDSQFLGARTARGTAAIMERWGRWLALPVAPFSWAPERVIVNAAGTIGLSTGPVYGADGEPIGNYSSVWVKQADGAWKILFDGAGPSTACFTDNAASVDEGFVTTDDGVRLHYKKIGAGNVTVIVPLESLLYDDVRQLADVATVIAYDLRNRGRSQHVSDMSKISLQRDVDDLEAVRQTLHIDKFIPIGFSYLGKMVALYAAAHPERVTALVQLGPVPLDASRRYESLPRETAGVQEEDWKKLQRLRAAPDAAQRGRELCEAEFNVNRHLLVGDPAHVFEVANPCALENEWPSNLNAHFERLIATERATTLQPAQLAKLTMPVLTIHGTMDRLAPYAGGRDWAAALPNARFVAVEGGGHASWKDDPSTVFAAIRAFVRSAGTSWPLSAEAAR